MSTINDNLPGFQIIRFLYNGARKQYETRNPMFLSSFLGSPFHMVDRGTQVRVNILLYRIAWFLILWNKNNGGNNQLVATDTVVACPQIWRAPTWQFWPLDGVWSRNDDNNHCSSTSQFSCPSTGTHVIYEGIDHNIWPFLIFRSSRSCSTWWASWLWILSSLRPPSSRAPCLVRLCAWELWPEASIQI